VETEMLILFYLTVPPAMFIAGILLVELDILKLMVLELKRFAMAIIILLAAIAALFEKLDKKYDKASKEF
jgi:hypothetical protein